MNKQIIIMEPLSGESLEKCCREAVALCLEEKTDVEFTHNNRKFKIGFYDILEKVFCPQCPEAFTRGI